jgi:four helix bundle protein
MIRYFFLLRKTESGRQTRTVFLFLWVKILSLLKRIKISKGEIKWKENTLSKGFKSVLYTYTSIGANVEEANGAYSKVDFASKMSIAYKEARETHYWLRLLSDSNILSETDCSPLLLDCEELQRILGSIIKTSRS